jgi:hypothetical protein
MIMAGTEYTWDWALTCKQVITQIKKEMQGFFMAEMVNSQPKVDLSTASRRKGCGSNRYGLLSGIVF